MENWIKLSLPHKSGTEMKYIEQAFADDWFVPLGPNVDEFERRLSEFVGGRPVVALSAGTAAIHLGLVMLGVQPGDEVICQSLPFAASANPIKYCGAKPVFVGSESETWNMSPDILRQAIDDRIKRTGRKPKAIIAVDLYGMPARLDEIAAIAAEYEIPLLEDSAEAMGSTLDGKMCGTFGEYGAMSFNGNKMITTSGGGALICPDEEAAARVKFLATQARENRPYYYHEVIGYNYRLSNISAGIGIGQLETIESRLARRREIHDIYSRELAGVACVKVLDNPSQRFNSNFWLTTILLDSNSPLIPDELRLRLAERHIETRLLWRPMDMQPVFADCPAYGDGLDRELFESGLCLPSGSSLTDTEVSRVIEALEEALG